MFFFQVADSFEAIRFKIFDQIYFEFVKFAVKNDTQCSYFYIPIWVIFVINQTFFTLIAIKVRRSHESNRGSQRHVERLMNSAELRQNQINDEDK